MGIVDVHLAAVGLDVEFAGHAGAVNPNEFSCCFQSLQTTKQLRTSPRSDTRIQPKIAILWQSNWLTSRNEKGGEPWLMTNSTHSKQRDYRGRGVDRGGGPLFRSAPALRPHRGRNPIGQRSIA